MALAANLQITPAPLLLVTGAGAIGTNFEQSEACGLSQLCNLQPKLLDPTCNPAAACFWQTDSAKPGLFLSRRTFFNSNL